MTLNIRNNYARWWYKQKKLKLQEKDKQTPLTSTPLISIIMPVYNAEPIVLLKAIRSVITQTYENWQLCIVDDCSTRITTKICLRLIFHKKIKLRYLESNLNISGASNQASKMCDGEYIALLDNDDVLEDNALYEVSKIINSTNADLIYSDEDFIDLDQEYESPHFKPDFSPDLLMSHNYITHLLVFKRKLFLQVGGFNSEYDGAQDYDLLLRMCEKAKNIQHIAKILYHWRKSPTSTSMNASAKPYSHEKGKAALSAVLHRKKLRGEVVDANLANYYRVKYKIIDKPLVSIIIPFKDQPDYLNGCLDSIFQLSCYENYEIIGVSNNSSDEQTFRIMEKFALMDDRFKFFQHNIEFNFSSLINFGVTKSKGEQLIFMNNDIEIINEDWLVSLLEHSQRDEIGVVGGKLLYKNNTIQHAGVGVSLGGAAGHLHLGSKSDAYGYFNRLNIVQNVSAVTGALMMVKRQVFDNLNGFDEQMFKIAYNDVDFCLRAMKSGLWNVFTPYCQAYHYESISRGYDICGEKLARLNREKDNLWQVHGDLLKSGDPFYNINLDQNRDDFKLPQIA